MPCYRCAKVQTDPVPHSREAPWARGVVGGTQILICPDCQREHPAWTEELDRCPYCGGTRLSVVMGSRVCRSCGADWPT